MVTKVSARSKPYAPVSARLCVYYPVRFCKDFSLTKTLNENVKLRRRICYPAKLSYSKEENIRKEWFVHATAREDNSIHVIPLLSVSKRCGFQIPGFGFRIALSLKLGFPYSLWLELEFKIQSLTRFRIPWAEIRIPKPRIPDSKSNDSKLHKQNYSVFRN